jgi:molybdopterin converting factor small subunit
MPKPEGFSSPKDPPGRPVAPGVVAVRFFSQAREVAGVSRLRVPLPGPVSLSIFLEELGRQIPGIVPLLRRARVALNGERLLDPGEDPPLRSGDEIAILPPFSGG